MSEKSTSLSDDASKFYGKHKQIVDRLAQAKERLSDAAIHEYSNQLETSQRNKIDEKIATAKAHMGPSELSRYKDDLEGIARVSTIGMSNSRTTAAFKDRIHLVDERDANLWQSHQHKEQHLGEYISEAKADAEAARKQINLYEPK